MSCENVSRHADLNKITTNEHMTNKLFFFGLFTAITYGRLAHVYHLWDKINNPIAVVISDAILYIQAGIGIHLSTIFILPRYTNVHYIYSSSGREMLNYTMLKKGIIDIHKLTGHVSDILPNRAKLDL